MVTRRSLYVLLFCLQSILIVASILRRPNTQTQHREDVQAEVQDEDASGCSLLVAPGKTPEDEEGRFAFLTSYYFHNATSSLYVLALGVTFFRPEFGKTNIAVNRSFPYERLRHPFDLFPFASKDDVTVKCHKVKTFTKDISMREKLVLMRCDFGKIKLTPGGFIFLVKDPGKTSQCLRLDASKPQGRLARFSLRPLRRPSEPSMSVCIGGITTFTPFAVEIVSYEIQRLGLTHFYLGLNSDDPALLQAYSSALRRFINDNRLSISAAPVSQADVEFSQGKLPFINDCLLHAKYHGDEFLGIWDLDELVIVAESGKVAAQLSASRDSIQQTTCYVQIDSDTYLADPTRSNGTRASLAESFPMKSRTVCGNYTKAISVVNQVDFLGVHLPEACHLYPSNRRFSSSQEEPFILKTDKLRIAHFGHLWKKRWEGRCTVERDSTLSERLKLD